MLSDLSYNTLPFDIPMIPDPSISQPEDPLAPLDFDDLLDIAREFEFTHTITHIWPCEEEPSTCPETGLEDILAGIMSTPNAKESPLPLTNSAPSMTLESIQVEQVDSHTPVSMCPVPDANASTSNDLVPHPKDGGQVRSEAEPPSASVLQGWSPPDGSQFLELDHSPMLPQSVRDVWFPPWLATFLDPSYPQCASSYKITGSSAMVPAIDDVQPQTSATEPVGTPVNTLDKIVDASRKETVPFVPSTRAILEPVRARSAKQINSLNTPSQTAIAPQAKAPKSRPSTLVAGGTSTPKYAKPPRGGIPPHIARTVTKANILRAEKERGVMRDAFSGATREGKKPSVLRKEGKVERETSKDGGGSAKKLSTRGENDEKGARAAKRARV